MEKFVKPIPKCRVCGRKLRSQKAIEDGMGRKCADKWKKKNTHKKLF